MASRLLQPIRFHGRTPPAKAWSKLLTRIAEAFLLACPACDGDIRLIAFFVADRWQAPAHFEPEVRERAEVRMALVEDAAYHVEHSTFSPDDIAVPL